MNVNPSSSANSLFWKSPQGTFCKVSLCALAIVTVLGGLTLAGLLLPHSSIGMIVFQAFGLQGSMGITAGLLVSVLIISTTIFSIYLKNRNKTITIILPSSGSNIQFNKLASNIQFNKLASNIQFNKLWQETIEQEFKTQKLSFLKEGLVILSKPFSIDFKGENYTIEYQKKDNSLSLKKHSSSEKMEIYLDEEEGIAKVLINGEESDSLEIPEEYQSLLGYILKMLIQQLSVYRINLFDDLDIDIQREGIAEIPEFHLNKCSSLILQVLKIASFPGTTVQFFSSSGPPRGVDAGGIACDYLDELFQKLTFSNNYLYFKKTIASVFAPQTKENYKTDGVLPTLTLEESLLCRDMGIIFMYCFFSSQALIPLGYSIGRRFDNALFNAVLSFTEEEIDTPFENLTFETQLKICKALAESDEGNKYLQNGIELLSKEMLDDEELKQAAHIAFFTQTFSNYSVQEDEEFENFYERLNQEKNKEEIIRNALVDAVFGYEWNLSQPGAQIAPIHAIAQGMKLACQGAKDFANKTWDKDVLSMDYKDFSGKVQGMEFDRAHIVNKLVYTGVDPIIRQKFNWLKEWLQEEGEEGASEEEIRKFLKVVTGSSSLYEEKYIQVDSQHAYQSFSIIPEIHTCSREIKFVPLWVTSNESDMGSDDTQEGLIQVIKDHVLNGEISYTTS